MVTGVHTVFVLGIALLALCAQALDPASTCVPGQADVPCTPRTDLDGRGLQQAAPGAGPMSLDDMVARFRLWPGLADPGGETLPFLAEALSLIWQSQHPEDCLASNVKYLVVPRSAHPPLTFTHAF